LRFGFLLNVRKEIEVGEKDKECNGVGYEDLWHNSWVVTLEVEGEEGVEENTDELDHLEAGEVLLPPEVRLHLGSKGREEVVEVHHGVHSRVEESSETSVTTSNKPGSHPSLKRHDAMVEDM